MPRKKSIGNISPLTIDYFTYGDKVIEMIRFLQSQKVQVRKMEIYKEISLETKYSSRTIRDAYYISMKIDKSIRERYKELSAEHFRQACSIRPGNPKEVLDWCLYQGNSHGGLPAPVSEMIKQFKDEKRTLYKDLRKLRNVSKKISIPSAYYDQWNKIRVEIFTLFEQIMKEDDIEQQKVVKIYKLINPENNIPFYIGKTEVSLSKRLQQHLGTDPSNQLKNNIVDLIKIKGEKPRIELIEEVPIYNAEEREKFWINEGLRNGWPLINLGDTY